MSSSARRISAVLFTLSLSLATVSALPAADAAPRSTHAVARSTWFTDPLTTLQRAALVRVPTHPNRYDGRTVQATRALYTSFDGSLAVPVEQSAGHQIETGQAITFQVPLSFPKRRLTGAHGRTLAALQTSLSTATRIRCEGYVRYGDDTPANDPHASRLRAQAMCDALAKGRTDLDTRSVGYGSSRPALIGGPASKQHTVRAANRRVVVIVTRTAPDPIVAPARISISEATFGDSEAKVRFAIPAAGASQITGYQYTLDGGISWADLDVNDTDNGLLSGTISGLVNGTAYHIRVRASSNAGHGAASARVGGTPTAVILKVAPAAVVVAHTFGNHQAVLSFSAPEPGTAPITRYEYTLDGGDHWVTLTTTGDGPIIGTISSLTNGTSYTVKVRAVSDDGNGRPSESFTGTPQAPAPPQVAPGQVVVGEFGFGDAAAGLAFEAPDAGSSPITKYQYTLDDGATWNDLATVGSDPFLGTITGLTNGTSYSIKVRAVSADGNGAASEALVGIPEPEAVAPGAPTLSGVEFGNDQAVLSFTAPLDTGSDPITGYEYSTDDGASWDTLPTTGTGPFTGTVTGLTNGTSYDVRVRAVSDAGEGDASTSVTGTPSAPVVP